MKKISINFSIVLLIAIIDQWSKYYVSHNFYLGETVGVIEGLFNFTYVRNSGAAFGFGGSFHDVVRLALFKVAPVFACLFLVYGIIVESKKNYIQSLAYTFILGGAIGNLIDRIRLDYVVDFFDFYWEKSHFATFNVADSTISIAAVLIIIDMKNNHDRNKNVKKD